MHDQIETLAYNAETFAPSAGFLIKGREALLVRFIFACTIITNSTFTKISVIQLIKRKVKSKGCLIPLFQHLIRSVCGLFSVFSQSLSSEKY